MFIIQNCQHLKSLMEKLNVNQVDIRITGQNRINTTEVFTHITFFCCGLFGRDYKFWQTKITIEYRISVVTTQNTVRLIHHNI